MFGFQLKIYGDVFIDGKSTVVAKGYFGGEVLNCPAPGSRREETDQQKTTQANKLACLLHVPSVLTLIKTLP
ncbi:unnamed protein product [marine sediment metagenome]|uniref:Uncharacterized protein n=1 Tax=marine sediment metagenome TaxID=412755 RepID=X1QWQ0_9ZZZZ